MKKETNMENIKVMAVFGTRPEAIKMCPLVLELQKYENITPIVCVTAQHREMLDQVLDIFGVKPDYDLDIMKTRQTLNGITTRVLEGMEDVLRKEKPDIVLVHGDTSTSFVAALASFYEQIKVGHVEAGLRTYDIYSPFPEEMNRQLTGRIANLHFSPTQRNYDNLIKENIDSEKIYITGNTVIDALKTTVKDNYEFQSECLRSLDFDNKRVIVVTAHRRENLGKPLEDICNAISEIVDEYPDTEVVYPVHLNPAVRETVWSILGDKDRVHLIDPLDVMELHNAISRSFMVMTDSGGIQEEAPALAKPVLVLRKETERPEAVAAGTVKIAGVDKEVIKTLAKELLDNQDEYNKMAHAANPYGDGEASRRICEAILYEFGLKTERPDEF
jgi:UDP-N-acetylglucosamine 2-epimerase